MANAYVFILTFCLHYFFFFNFWSRNERYLLLERFSSKATDKLVQLWNCQPSKRSPLEIGWFLVFHAKWVRSINGIWNKFQTKSPIKPSVVQNKTVNVLSNSKLGLNVRGCEWSFVHLVFVLFAIVSCFFFHFPALKISFIFNWRLLFSINGHFFRCSSFFSHSKRENIIIKFTIHKLLFWWLCVCAPRKNCA